MHICKYGKAQCCSINEQERRNFEEECIRKVRDFGGSNLKNKEMAVIIPFIRRFLRDGEFRLTFINILTEIDEEICEMDLIEDLSNGCNPRMEL